MTKEIDPRHRRPFSYYLHHEGDCYFWLGSFRANGTTPSYKKRINLFNLVLGRPNEQVCLLEHLVFSCGNYGCLNPSHIWYTTPEDIFLGYLLQYRLGECWKWQGPTAGGGYGKFDHDGETFRAHTFSYEFYNGPLEKGLQINHSCDNPPCVNPEHLVAGTQRENVEECIERGRRKPAIGNQLPQTKLTVEEVKTIKRLFKEGYRIFEVNKLFPQVTRRSIKQIRNNKSWKHVII